MTLGDKLQVLLKKNDMSQKQLSDLLGYSTARINQWIKNKRDINKNELILLSEIFHVDIKYFLYEDIELDYLLSVEGLNDNQVEIIKALIDAFKEKNDG